MLLHARSTFISGNCQAHCVIAELASDGWFSIYLCCFQEFPVKHQQHNQIMVIKRKKYY